MEIKGDPFMDFLRTLARINLKLKLEEKIMEHNFKVGDIVVQTGTCEFYTVGKLLDGGRVEMMPNEHGFARRFHESALELAPPIGDAYIPHIPKATIEVDASNWGKSRVEEIAKSISYPGVSYFPNLEHTYLPNEDDLKYIKDDMELTKEMAERIYSKTTHRDIAKELRKTYEKKNKDYGDSFANSLDKHGLIAAIVRMDDKMSRLSNLVGADELMVTSESMRDTVMDLANYAIMTAMWMDNNSDERMVVFERGEL